MPGHLLILRIFDSTKVVTWKKNSNRTQHSPTLASLQLPCMEGSTEPHHFHTTPCSCSWAMTRNVISMYNYLHGSINVFGWWYMTWGQVLLWCIYSLNINAEEPNDEGKRNRSRGGREDATPFMFLTQTLAASFSSSGSRWRCAQTSCSWLQCLQCSWLECLQGKEVSFFWAQLMSPLAGTAFVQFPFISNFHQAGKRNFPSGTYSGMPYFASQQVTCSQPNSLIKYSVLG